MFDGALCLTFDGALCLATGGILPHGSRMMS
jgi:hypothetical protein